MKTQSQVDPIASLKYRAAILVLVAATVGGGIATVLHWFQADHNLLSRVIPPLSVGVTLTLLVYLLRQPERVYQVTRLMVIWGSFIFLFPVYFYAIEAVIDPPKRLIDSFPPISSAFFLLTTCVVVFLRPGELVKTALLLWAAIAAPVLVYMAIYPEEAITPRGLDLIIAIFPAMGVNLSLTWFYVRLEDMSKNLYLERAYLQDLSERDALTGAFNRGTGERMLRQLLIQGQVGIILCDIDHFKQVNDRYGHQMGDQVLQIVCQTCQAQLRKADLFVRWGGEEFMVVVEGGDQGELGELAERLRAAIANQKIPDLGKVTASFGVAVGEGDLSTLFARADQALYQAKKSGRDRVVLG
ncbi:MAG: GGDEF domain-containing protein [Pseudanabaenaceae cyanobacterium bins.68]|nr:GGDEF domain-containing protein [Pseudanabaenaceae cyanobacterium bins.68]